MQPFKQLMLQLVVVIRPFVISAFQFLNLYQILLIMMLVAIEPNRPYATLAADDGLTFIFEELLAIASFSQPLLWLLQPLSGVAPIDLDTSIPFQHICLLL